jgi:hypothetical protein
MACLTFCERLSPAHFWPARMLVAVGRVAHVIVHSQASRPAVVKLPQPQPVSASPARAQKAPAAAR